MKDGFMREVQYPDWLANVVLVKKSNRTYEICVDFTNLNKACPKDSFPLPMIDKLVDLTTGYGYLSSLDAKQGYHQIRMCLSDEEKTSFITENGTYCYIFMPFGLKNAGATYQRLVNKMFKNLFGKNLEAYVDDMIVKSRSFEDHLKDLDEVIKVIDEYGMKLNPEKCVLFIQAGKFLEYMVSEKRIELNPDKVKAILDMVAPRNTKVVQKLIGRIIALSRFLSK